MMLENYGVTEENWRDGAAVNPHFAAISESPRFVGRAVAALAADPDVHRRNGGSFSSGGLAKEYGFTDLDGSQPDAWRYLVEVQDAGLPADPDRLSLGVRRPAELHELRERDRDVGDVERSARTAAATCDLDVLSWIHGTEADHDDLPGLSVAGMPRAAASEPRTTAARMRS